MISKKQFLTVIGAFLLVVMLGTITYAFFNYTRTGTANVIKTGKISFNANQTETINLTNVFPIDKTTIGTDSVNTDEAVITITGDTTYTEGIEYLVTAVDVNNTIGSGNNAKTVPISVSVTATSGLGTEDEEYFDNRENANTHMYRVLAKDVLEENGRIAVGYIKAGSTGINGTLTVKAYLDKDRIAISDTYDGEESDNMGTTTEWVDGRVVLTTNEWNSLQGDGVSFKVKVESNEGIWVEEILSVNAMNTFPTAITDEKANIKEVYFNKMGATRMQNAYDAATIKADLTYNSEGKVLAWLETNSDDNTKYNLIIASDGDTYLTTGNQLFAGYSNIDKIEFNNIDTSRVTNMSQMFAACTNLSNIDITSFNTSNVTTMNGMFVYCTSLTTLDLSGKGGNNLTNVGGMFVGSSNLLAINMNGFDFGNTSSIRGLFENLTNLESLDLKNVKVNSVNTYIGVADLFKNCSSLTEINLSSFSVTCYQMFSGCTSLKIIDLSGLLNLESTGNNTSLLFANLPALEKIYVSPSTDFSNQPNIMAIFGDTPNLVGGNGTHYSDDNPKDKTYAIIDGTNGQPGYFTDIADKPTN